ncbi:MAG: ATP-binding protein [Armatimonadota bacterium]
MSTDFAITRCLPDVPGCSTPTKWRTMLREPTKTPRDGWRLDIPAVSSTVCADLQRRVEGGFMKAHNEVDGHPWFAAGLVCISTPDTPSLADHPSNALALLAAIYELCVLTVSPTDWLYSGSIASDGTVLPASHPIQLALEAKRQGVPLVLEKSSAKIATAVYSEVYGVANATDLHELMANGPAKRFLYQVQPRTLESVALQDYADLSYVIGQPKAKTAMEIAVAGGHPLALIGPPGCGKSLMASCLPGIAPPLTAAEKLEVALVWHASGRLAGDQLPSTRPLRSIDNNTSKAALLGGGTDVIHPGEVSLAHGGYLYIDEMLLMSRAVLEALRTPMQSGIVQISRVGFKVEFPSRFTLIAAANPCPCAHWSEEDPSKCRCSKPDREKYQAKLSGAVMDRIHIITHLKQPNALDTLDEETPREASAMVKLRVLAATEVQYARQGRLNAMLGARDLPDLRARLFPTALPTLRAADLSLRGLTNILKLSQTIADLAGSDRIELGHVTMAMEYSQKHL